MAEPLPGREDPVPGKGSEEQQVLVYQDVAKAFTSGGRVVHALQGADFSIRPGSITGLVGPDGAGKTTAMRLAAGLLAPDRGSVTVLGLDAARESLRIQSLIGYMPQRFGLYEDLSVQENLDLYADLQGVRRADRQERYAELMRMTGLGDFTERLAGRLSGGMKQKLGLACTLVHPPDLLLLDEPTVGVDPVSRRELWSIVFDLVEEQGMTVLMSTAYLDEAERCHEVVLLHEGKVMGAGAPDTFVTGLKGRVFLVDVPEDLNRRELQEHLAAKDGVLDAVIQGEQVRLVLPEGKTPRPKEWLQTREGLHVTPAKPRFEDGYVDMLAGNGEPSQTREEDSSGQQGSPEEQQGPVIDVEKASRRFGDFYAVREVSFQVNAGEVFGLLGANGAGKTTTFRMLCGLLPASEGRLTVAGRDLRHAAARARARIGYMSQKFSLYRTFSVRQNMEFFSSAYNLTGRRRSRRIQWALERFDLQDQQGAVNGDLPLGYKQRLALACALMPEPDILFLDEPTSGVDPLARRQFWHHINVLASKGVTVMVTTHFMEEAEYCDRLAIMSAGSILALGTPLEIKRRAGSKDHPEPSIEEAFISLIQREEQPGEEAA